MHDRWRRHRVQVRLALPWLSVDESTDYERRLNRLMNACGCIEGAAMAVALPSFLALLSWSLVTDWSVITWILLSVAGLMAFIAGGVLGKWAGVALARRRLYSLTRQLARLADARDLKGVLS